MVLLNLLIKSVWLVVENKVQNQLGHQAFGTFMALFSFTYIFGVLSDLGLNQYTTKQLAAGKNFQLEYFSVLFSLKWLFTILFPFLIMAGGWVMGYGKTELYYLLIIAFGFTLTQFIFFLRAILQGAHYFNRDAVASVGERLSLLLLVMGLFNLGITLERYIFTRTLAILVAFLGLYLVVFKLFGPFSFNLKWVKVKQLVKASFPFAVIMLVYGVNEKVDMVMLERLASGKEVGIYAAAYRWVDATMMYLWTILPIFFARFAGAINQPLVQHKLLQFGQIIVAVPIIFASIFVFFYGRLLFWQFSNSSLIEIDQMLRNLYFLFGNVLVHGFFAIYSTLLTASNYEKQVGILVITSISLNVMLNSVFIPQYGSVAAAANTLGCAVFVSMGYLILARSKLGIQLPGFLIIKLLTATLTLAGIFYGLKTISDTWYWNTIGAALLFIPVIFLLQIIKLSDLRTSLQTSSDSNA